MKGGPHQARLIVAYEAGRATNELRDAVEGILRKQSAGGMLNGGNTVAMVAAEGGRRAEALFDNLVGKLWEACPSPEGFAILSHAVSAFRHECEATLVRLFGRHVHSGDEAIDERMRAAGIALLNTSLEYVDAKLEIARIEFGARQPIDAVVSNGLAGRPPEAGPALLAELQRRIRDGEAIGPTLADATRNLCAWLAETSQQKTQPSHKAAENKLRSTYNAAPAHLKAARPTKLSHD